MSRYGSWAMPVAVLALVVAVLFAAAVRNSQRPEVTDLILENSIAFTMDHTYGATFAVVDCPDVVYQQGDVLTCEVRNNPTSDPAPVTVEIFERGQFSWSPGAR